MGRRVGPSLLVAVAFCLLVAPVWLSRSDGSGGPYGRYSEVRWGIFGWLVVRYEEQPGGIDSPVAFRGEFPNVLATALALALVVAAALSEPRRRSASPAQSGRASAGNPAQPPSPGGSQRRRPLDSGSRTRPRAAPRASRHAEHEREPVGGIVLLHRRSRPWHHGPGTRVLILAAAYLLLGPVPLPCWRSNSGGMRLTLRFGVFNYLSTTHVVHRSGESELAAGPRINWLAVCATALSVAGLTAFAADCPPPRRGPCRPPPPPPEPADLLPDGHYLKRIMAHRHRRPPGDPR